VTALVVSEAHCSVEFHPDWPLSADRGPERGALSQPIADSGGSVFLHYGPTSTLEAYVGGWRARYRDGARVTADRPIVTRDGLKGRCLALALDEEVVSRLGDSRSVTPPQTLVCSGYAIRSMPVLLGYIVPQATEARLVEEADRILASLRQAG
jgi:hypothetical protein